MMQFTPQTSSVNMSLPKLIYSTPAAYILHVSHTSLTGALVALGSNAPYDEATVVAVGDTVVGVLVEVVVPEHLLKW